MLKILGSLFALVLVGAGAFVKDTATQAAAAPGDIIPGQYIVVLNDDADADAEAGAAVRAHGVTSTTRTRARSRASPSAAQPTPPPRSRRAPRPVRHARPCRYRSRRPERIRQARGLRWDTTRTKAPDRRAANRRFIVEQHRSGVGVAVIDTGIDLTHPDLALRSTEELHLPGQEGKRRQRPCSHVAGTIAARDNRIGVVGVAPLAQLYAVKVLTRGQWLVVVCHLRHRLVTNNAGKYNIKVANMSLGGSGSDDGNCGYKDGARCIRPSATPLPRVLLSSSRLGMATSSGIRRSCHFCARCLPRSIDGHSDCRLQRPAGGGAAATCRTDVDDTAADFSNYATSTADQSHTIAAPGVCILSTGRAALQHDQRNEHGNPHVTGTVALCIAGSSGF